MKSLRVVQFDMFVKQVSKHIYFLQGERGANSLQGPDSDKNVAIKLFEKKFKDKTKNNWTNRNSFNPVKGKYTLIEMADEEEDEVDAAVSSTPHSYN